MDTDERAFPVVSEASHLPEGADRWRALSGQLGAEVDSMRGDLARALAAQSAAQTRLRELHVRQVETQLAARSAEYERQHAAAELTRARLHIGRIQPLLRDARTLLISMQSSRFWKIRNGWFGLKKRLRLSSSGPQPWWVPDADDVNKVFERDPGYERWVHEHRMRPADIKRLREMLPLFTLRPTFSVLMPVYNTSEEFLRAAIESVQTQVYPDWELCIADDASTKPHVRQILQECAAGDPRIKLVFRESNGRIAATSNSALAIASGDFIALLDHDDVLTPDALFENALVVNRRPDVDIIYSDEDKIEEGRLRDPYFKPDWSPDSLLSRNYVSHLGVYRRSLLQEIGGFREGFDGSQDYDLVLRASEHSGRVEHIPRVLYHWRIHDESTASHREQKGHAYDAAAQAIEQALVRRGEPGRVLGSDFLPGTYTVRYEIQRAGRISIIIPTRDHGDDVDRCLTSVFAGLTYPDIEVVLLDNGTTDRNSLSIFGSWLAREPERVKLVSYDVPFNFSKINNYAAQQSSGSYLLFLNNDTEVITPDWLEAMVEQAQRPSIGAVGAKLLYADGTVQHAGVIIGLGGVAGHSHKYFPSGAPGYFGTLQTVNNFSAVTAACLMVRRDVFDEVGGFDERLAIAFNDVDFCLRVQAAGYQNIYLPHVELFHHESKSRGHEDTPQKRERFFNEQVIMRERWNTGDYADPHYNRNLTLDTEDFAIGL
jgi:GT2 family glycosyltransferase